MITLYESNGGHLAINNDATGDTFDVTGVQRSSSFGADARALRDGHVSDWTVPQIEDDGAAIRASVNDDADGWREIAQLHGDDLYLISRVSPGVAARTYLGADLARLEASR